MHWNQQTADYYEGHCIWPLNIRDFLLFLKICVKFEAFKNLYPPEKQKNVKNLKKFEEKRVSVSEKKITFFFISRSEQFSKQNTIV